MAATPLRVAHVITGLASDGAQNMLCKLLAACRTQAVESCVYSLTDEGILGARIRALGVPVVALGMPRGRPDLSGFRRLRQELRRQRPHLVQTWLYHADLAGLLAARSVGLRNVIWNIRCADMGPGYRRGMNGLMLRLLARISGLPAAVIANSHEGQRYHAAIGYRPRRWEVLPNGFDVARFHPDPAARERLRREWQIPEETPLIGLVGRYDPVKGHALFLEAAARVASRRPDARFLLAGEGTAPGDQPLCGLIRQHGLSEKVMSLGWRDDVPAVTAALDIAVCASQSEGFANVIGEAMACAVPCLVTDVGDSADVVGDDRLVAPYGDAEAMAAGLARLLAMPREARSSIGQAGRTRVLERYDLAKVAARYLALYRHIASRAHNPRMTSG